MIVGTKHSLDDVHPVSVRFTAKEVEILHRVLSHFAMRSTVEEFNEKDIPEFMMDMDWVARFVEENNLQEGEDE